MSVETKLELEEALDQVKYNPAQDHVRIIKLSYAIEDAFGGAVRLRFVGLDELCLAAANCDELFVSLRPDKYGATLYDRIYSALQTTGV